MNEIYEIKLLEEELRLLPGHNFFQEMNSLNDSIYVLDSNFSELESHIEKLKQYKIKGFTKNPNLETKRLVHNYLCAAITLIDHTRIYVTNIHREKDFIDYQPKIDETFIKNPLCTFIKDFRQYLQHYKLPEITFQTNALSIKPNWSIKIKTEELMKFSGWKSNSKIFIKSQIKSVDLHKAIKEYHKIVNAFYKWLIGRQKEIFETEITEFNEKLNQIKIVKIEHIISNVLSSKYSNFKVFENDFHQVWNKKEIENLNSENPLKKIKRMIEMLEVEHKLKVEFENKLESLLI